MALICFDLDGTLVDPRPGLLPAVAATCSDLGLAVPPEKDIVAHIGFGMGGLFRHLAGEARLQDAMTCYWKHFSEEALCRHRIYEGVHLMLARLKRQGHRLYIITAKPATFARQVLFHFDLHLIFDDVIGPGPLDAWCSKHLVLDTLASLGVLSQPGFMIGDRGDDMRAAKAHGLCAVGVAYGFGNIQELQEAGADTIATSVAELEQWLNAQLTDSEIHDAFTRSE